MGEMQYTARTTALQIIDACANFGLDVSKTAAQNTAIFEEIKTVVGTNPAVVFIRPGVYVVNAGLTIPGTIELVGGGVTISGITARITPLRYRQDFFTPQQFGAKADGSNDTTAIQAAIDAAAANGGGIVVFAAGTYKHTGLNVPAKVTLQGVGMESSILDCTSSISNGITLIGSARYVSILDLKLHSSGASTGWAISGTGGVVGDLAIDRYIITGFKNGIDIWEAINSRIGHGRMQGQGRTVVGGRGVKLGDGTTKISTTVTIESAYFSDYEWSVQNAYCPSLLLINTVFEYCKRAVYTTQYTIMIDPYFEAVDDYHIYADGDGVVVLGGYSLDSAKIFLDAAYGSLRSLFLGGGKSESQIYQKFMIGNGGTAITRHLSGTVVWDPASVADGAQINTTVTVAGAVIGDTVAVGFSTAVPAGALLMAAVTAANTATVTLFNKSGAALDLASGTLRVDVWQH